MVKFGRFVEIEEASESKDGSDDEDEDVSVSELEVVPDVASQVAIVAEQHAPGLNVVDDYDDDDVDNVDKDKGKGIDEGDDAMGFNDEDFTLDFELNNDDISSSFDFDNVNDVSAPPETEGDSNILKLPSKSLAQMAEVIV